MPVISEAFAVAYVRPVAVIKGVLLILFRQERVQWDSRDGPPLIVAGATGAFYIESLGYFGIFRIPKRELPRRRSAIFGEDFWSIIDECTSTEIEFVAY